MFMKKQNKKRGFTITELVIVISVIAILSAVMIPTFSGLINKSKKSAAAQEASHALTAVLTEENAQLDTTKTYYFISGDYWFTYNHTDGKLGEGTKTKPATLVVSKDDIVYTKTGTLPDGLTKADDVVDANTLKTLADLGNVAVWVD